MSTGNKTGIFTSADVGQFQNLVGIPAQPVEPDDKSVDEPQRKDHNTRNSNTTRSSSNSSSHNTSSRSRSHTSQSTSRSSGTGSSPSTSSSGSGSRSSGSSESGPTASSSSSGSSGSGVWSGDDGKKHRKKRGGKRRKESSAKDDSKANEQIALLNNTVESLREEVVFVKRQLQRAAKGGAPIVFSGDPAMVQGVRGRIKMISAGSHHCLALTELGEVFAWGKGTEGQLGIGDNKSRTEPTYLPLKQIRSVFAIANQSFAISESGNVFAWGDNTSGQLGLGDKARQAKPVLVKSLQAADIVFIAGGKAHTVAVADDGSVYTWGDNTNGQLGHSDRQPVFEPKLVSALTAENIRTAAATDDQTFVIAEGDVRDLLVEPDKAQHDARLTYLQQVLVAHTQKRQRQISSLVDGLRELRRQCNALERDISKADKSRENIALAADCHRIIQSAMDEEQTLDVDHWEQISRELESVRRENELLKGHILAEGQAQKSHKSGSSPTDSIDSNPNASSHSSQHSGRDHNHNHNNNNNNNNTANNTKHSTGDIFRTASQKSSSSSNGSHSSQHSSVSSTSESDLDEVPRNVMGELEKLLKERMRLRRHITRPVDEGPARSQVRLIQPKLDSLNTKLTQLLELNSVSSAGYSFSKSKQTETFEQLADLWSILRTSPVHLLPSAEPSDNSRSVRFLLRESSSRVTNVIVALEKNFGESLYVNSREPYIVLPQVLHEAARMQRRINDYTEGMLVQAIQRLERDVTADDEMKTRNANSKSFFGTGKMW